MGYDEQKWKERIDQVIAKGPFTDTWESLSAHETPKWFRDAKFGIFIHWGLYSVPAFGSEWYSRNMYREGTPEFRHHQETYGLQKNFGYKDFVNQFRAEDFDPDAWAKLFLKAGAKYVVPVAEHHDGFQMYKSELSHWNAFEKGPKRDVLGELMRSFDKCGLIRGASSHRMEHWFFMSPGQKPLADGTPAEDWSDVPEYSQKKGDIYWSSVPLDEDDFDDRCMKPSPSKDFLDDWLYRTVEIIDNYRPRQLYFDWWVFHEAAKPYMRRLLAYYYNRAVQWDEEVMVITKNDGIPYGCAVPDMERGGFDQIQPESWQTDTAIGKKSWGYTADNTYKSANTVLLDLIDAISRNGSMLLNVGPRPDGTIGDEDTKVLLEIGEWLKRNGEAVYGSRPWRIAGEGPTSVKRGAFADQTDTVYTSEDFRFTVNHGHLYIFAMNYPRPERHGTSGKYSEIRVRSLACRPHPQAYEFAQLIKEITVLGSPETPKWTQTEDELVIRTKNEESGKPVVFRVEFL